MSLSARRSAGVIAVAAATGLVAWAVVRLLGVELTVGKAPDPNQVGPLEVLVATVLAGLAAWGSTGCWPAAREPPDGGRSSAAPPSPSRCSVPATLPTAPPLSP